MHYTVEIDDSTQTGKSLVDFLKNLSKSTKGIHLIETIEDNELLDKMKKSIKSGRATKQEVNKTLKAILGK